MKLSVYERKREVGKYKRRDTETNGERERQKYTVEIEERETTMNDNKKTNKKKAITILSHYVNQVEW